MSFSPNDSFWLNVTRGLIEEYDEVHKFGTNDAVGTTFVPIARGGLYQTPTAAVALEIVSSSASDTVAGIGARTVKIEGLDAGWNYISQTVNTNGLGAVSVPISLTRGFRMKVEDSGSYATQVLGSHVGDLTLRTAGAGPTWLLIPTAGFPRGQTQCGVYTVPAGKSAVVYPHYLSVDSNKSADIIFFTRDKADIVAAPFVSMKAELELVGVTGFSLAIDVASPQGPFIGPVDIGYMGRFGTGTGAISVDFEIVQYDTPV